MSARHQGAHRSVALYLLLFASALACLSFPRTSLASEQRLVVPGTIVFAPNGPGREATVLLFNPGTEALPISSLGVRGRDWGGFVITDEHNPDLVPAGGQVALHLEVDPRAFEVVSDHGAGKTYRSGRGKLQIEATDGLHEVPLRFVPSPRPTPFPPLLAFSLWCLPVLPLISGRASLPAERGARALCLGALLAVLAALPLGAGWCDDPTLSLAGDLARARCRVGLGGGHLALVPARLGAWWLIAGVTALAVMRHASTRADFDRERIAWLSAALILGAAGAGGWDLAAGFGENFVPRPGIALACISCWALSKHADTDRLSDLAWSATVTVVFGAGPRIPGLALDLGSPGATLALGAGVIGLKMLLLGLLVEWAAKLDSTPRLHWVARSAGLLGFFYGAWS